MSPTTGNNGDTVTVTGTISNPTGATASPGYNTVLTYTTTAGKISINNASFSQGTCTAPTSVVYTSNSIMITYATIPVSTSCQFSFTGTLGVSVIPDESEAIVGTGTWQSEPGNAATQLDSFNASSNIRSGNTSNIGGALNDYVYGGVSTAMSPTVTIKQATVNLALTPPTATTVPVGSVVTYDFSTAIPQGTSPTVQVVMTIPPGLVFQQTSGFTAGSLLACSSATCTLRPPSTRRTSAATIRLRGRSTTS